MYQSGWILICLHSAWCFYLNPHVSWRSAKILAHRWQETTVLIRPWSPKLLFGLPAIAFVAMGARWFLQGTQNIYSALRKRYYLQDPDLGWRVVLDGPIWLGLDSIVAVLCLLVCLAFGVWFVRRRERDNEMRATGLRGILWICAIASLGVPILAFVTGLPPADSRHDLPAGTTEPIPVGIHAHLSGIPKGRYQTAAHTAASATARLEAGGEQFEARFSGVSGEWLGDPGDLGHPMSVHVEFAAASVDTGIALRSKHAREELKVERYPRIRFELGKITGVGKRRLGGLVFSARGNVILMGTTQAVNVTGALRVLDADGRQRLGGLADAAAFVVNASFTIRIDQTPIGNDGTFSKNEVPIQCTVIFVND